jgi:hypothetical protein
MGSGPAGVAVFAVGTHTWTGLSDAVSSLPNALSSVTFRLMAFPLTG